MNVSMGQLVNDAKELVMRLKEREKNVDQVVVQSNALSKKVDSIQQLENEFIGINETANHRSKVAVLSSIQKENKVIKLLQQENEDLKESLEEHQSVLEIIMSKYRQQMLQLIRLKKQQELSETYYQSAIFKNLQEKTDQIAEMTEVMKHAIDLDEKTINEREERLQSLLVENQGLKELLRIKSRYGNSDANNNVNLVNKEVQTDPSQETNKVAKVLVEAPFNFSEDMSCQKSAEMSAIEVQTESTMELDLPTNGSRETDEDTKAKTKAENTTYSEAIVVELDKSVEPTELPMQFDESEKSTEQQVVELTENLIEKTESVIAQVKDVVLEEVEDVPKENVPPVEASSEVMRQEIKSEEAVVRLESEQDAQQLKYKTEIVIKSSPSTSSKEDTVESPDSETS